MLRAYAGGRVFGEVGGDGPVSVVALHGWGRSRHDLLGAVSGTAAVVLDLPGFGASPPPPEAWGAREYADLVAGVVEEAADPPVTVVGHSFGGRVAVCLAARRPDLVGGLVLTGVPLVRVRPPRRPPLLYRVLRALHRLHLASGERLERARSRHGSADYRAASGVMRGVLVRVVNESYEPELAALACPVDLVWGEHDADVPVSVAEQAAALAASARLTVVAGAGHDLPLSEPGALRDAVERVRGAVGS